MTVVALSFLVLRKPFYFFEDADLLCSCQGIFFHTVNMINIFLSLTLLLPSGISVVLIVEPLDQSSVLLLFSS